MKILLEGGRASLESLAKEVEQLRSSEPLGFDLCPPSPKTYSLTERRSHGQVEVWQVVVDFLVGVSVTVASDQLLRLLEKYRGRITVAKGEELLAGNKNAAGADSVEVEKKP